MDPNVAEGLRSLLQGGQVAALGTLHGGAPHVSMVPFALLASPPAFVIHVSGLAAHTRDMLEDSRVSLMVAAAPDPSVPPQATPRVTIQAQAAPLAAAESEYPRARASYLERFPDSAMTFELADFSLFLLRPVSLRFVGGFAQAKTVTPEGLAAILAGR